MTIKEILGWGISQLSKLDSPRLDTELIIADILDEDRLYVMINPDKKLTHEQTEIIKTNILLRKSNYPIHYILKKREFMGREFEVEAEVLIPRPDTEILVEQTLDEIRHLLKQTGSSVLGMEIGSGSGIISVSLLADIKELRIIAVDINDKALELTRRNACAHEVEKRLEIRKSDLFENAGDLKGSLDFIVSNPPYIARDVIQTLSEDIKRFEPLSALDGGSDGLDFYTAIIKAASEYIKPGGFAAFEIGYDQGKSVQNLLLDEGFSHCRVVKDLAGLDRVVIGRKI